MTLDPRTLLFCLILTNILAVLSLVIATSNGKGKQDGMGKWAIAMFLETLTWALVSARGLIPDVFSIIAANGLKASSHALILMAICEFQRRSPPRWQLLVPVALTLLMALVFADDMRGRVLWGSLIYGFQMALIARALLTDLETRAGRAWQLLLGGVAAIMLVLVLRAATALSGFEFSQPADAAAHPVQIIVFAAMMGSAILGSIGFVLLVKERADREILHLAMTDSLTGVANRRSLMEQAEHALSRRNGLPLALLMIDVDHFKRINDAHGHPAGDEVLRKVTERMAGRLRGHDVLGRYGGEEFCVVAPDTDTAGALALAESLRQVIAATPLATERGTLSVSVSIGVALCPANATRKLKDMLAEADTMLYAAKQAGRDRVVISDNLGYCKAEICA